MHTIYRTKIGRKFYEKVQNSRNINDNSWWMYGTRWSFCMIPALILGTDKFDIGQYFGEKKITE